MGTALRGEQAQTVATLALRMVQDTGGHIQCELVECELRAGLPGISKVRIPLYSGGSAVVTQVEAERSLLEAALADALNQRFVLLSDSCIPLYPPAFAYLQLMAEQRSRVNACSKASDPQDPHRRMDFR